ncbi:hypothetical protein [Peribacillus frigoritolerans]|uniref:hypothetical protein n=1 Tax=Peribacillus frigoritolerans TaxID=450367 RepID=UPI0031D723E4
MFIKRNYSIDWSGSARLPAGAAGQVKTPQGLRQGYSPPRGKRASGAEVRDSCGNSGKRASGGEINHTALLSE